MVSLQKAQTGARVYNGGSLSPNKGQVSYQGAQGYIQRELNNKAKAGPMRQVGSDGQSDSRSTVAAQALQRNMQANAPKQTQTSINQAQQSAKVQGVQPTAAPVGNTPPPVLVNPTGTLELPYNQDVYMEILNQTDQANKELLGLKQQADQQNLDYMRTKRESQLAYDSLRSQTLNDNAARGTAFSSGYGTAVTRNANEYANQVSDLESANTLFQSQNLMQQTAIQDSLNAQIEAILQGYAHSLGENEAGNLGYGQATTPKPAAPKPAAKPAAKSAAKPAAKKNNNKNNKNNKNKKPGVVFGKVNNKKNKK